MNNSNTTHWCKDQHIPEKRFHQLIGKNISTLTNNNQEQCLSLVKEKQRLSQQFIRGHASISVVVTVSTFHEEISSMNEYYPRTLAIEVQVEA